LERNFHPTVIVRGYMRALQTALDTCNQISRTIDVNNTTEMREIVTSVRFMPRALLSCTAVLWSTNVSFLTGPALQNASLH
jgi:chaperonin GroEL (HSP60 family)